jgi:endonuclease YncB( thermonuclease family)
VTPAVWRWPDSTVTRVIDGDTFVARLARVVDIGFHGTSTTVFEQRLRLNRIDAARASTPQGRLAARVLADRTVDRVLIETVGPYKYRDEWMAEVTLPDGSNLSDLLVAEGHAVYWNGVGARPGG